MAFCAKHTRPRGYYSQTGYEFFLEFATFPAVNKGNMRIASQDLLLDHGLKDE